MKSIFQNNNLRRAAIRRIQQSTTTNVESSAVISVSSCSYFRINNSTSRSYSSTPLTWQEPKGLRYAAVDHGEAYEAALAGQHGKQLELAALEGIGKDDLPFDPFIEEEMEEDRLLALSKQQQQGGNQLLIGGNDDSAEADENEEEDNEDDYDENDWRLLYNNDGSLKRLKSEKARLAAGAPAGGMFAIIELAGSQHKVTTDDVLIVNRMKPVSDYPIGSIHTLTYENILLLGSSHYTLIGMPHVPGAEVDIMVEEITKDVKIIIFSKRRRKNSKRKNGFRRDVTMLRILDIRPPPSHVDAYMNHRPLPEVSTTQPQQPSIAAAVAVDRQKIALNSN